MVPQLYGFQTNLVNLESWTRDASLKNWVHTTLSVTLFRVSSNFVFRNIVSHTKPIRVVWLSLTSH